MIEEKMNHKDIKKNADKILYEYGLINELNKYGKCHVIGSYKMDLMVWNDLDLDIENKNINMNSIYNLTKFIFDKYLPIWFEGKETVLENKKCYFLGFETNILKETWNIDLWFFDKLEIEKCEKYCNEISEKINENKELQNYIIEIKKELIQKGMYSSSYNSVDVYDAVLNYEIKNTDELIKKYKKRYNCT
jgi:hypothetical protein